MPTSIISAVGASFSLARVRWFRPMGARTAATVVGDLRAKLPNGQRLDSASLQAELETKGHYLGSHYLNRILPELTIGHQFNEQECALLAALDRNEQCKLFTQDFKEPGRRVKMWHAFYKHDPVEALLLLERLCDPERGLDRLAALDFYAGFGADVAGASRMWRAYFHLNEEAAVCLLHDLLQGELEDVRAALTGAADLTDADVGMAQRIMTIANARGSFLPYVLAGFNHPVVWQAVSGLGREFLTNQFARIYIYNGAKPDRRLLSSLLAHLGPEGAYKFYSYLTCGNYGVLDPAPEILRDYPSLRSFMRATGGDARQAAGILTPVIATGIEAATVRFAA